MTKEAIFWGLFLLSILLYGIGFWGDWTWFPKLGGLIPFILIGLLGWRVFGAAIK